MAPAARRVLVVDDQPDAVDSLACLLRLSGHDVNVAYDGAAAVETALRTLPEVVFLDIGLPALDGYAVANALRRAPALRGVRVVAVTAYGDDESRRKSREAGFDEHLVKPVEPRFLVALLEGRHLNVGF